MTSWMRGALALALLGVSSAQAAPFGFSDRKDGISCPYFDVAAGARWEGGRPTWVDTKGRPGGGEPFASDVSDKGGAHRVRRLDVTDLVRQWWSGERPNDGLLLRVRSGDMVAFHSHEVDDPALRPQLLLVWADGRRRYLEPVADATLDCSTYTGLGGAPNLVARPNTWVALRFKLDPSAKGATSAPAKAELVLVREAAYQHATQRLEAYALRSPLGVAGPPRSDGIASRYPRDKGLQNDPDVLFVDGFEGWDLSSDWTRGMRGHTALVDSDETLGFVPLSGKALRVTIPRNEVLGLDLRYRFKDRQGSEPDEVYFRYYLRLAKDWLGAVNGGKLPGLAGTYGLAGWGGRQWDGRKGWSLRGSYSLPLPAGHPAAGKVVLGTYAYHSKATAKFGEGLQWVGGGLAGAVGPNEWHCIEQHVKLNTPGQENGVLQVWVDGQLALDYPNLRVRDLPILGIEEVWMNFYHGGIDKAVVDMHAYVDHVVIARRYIGPLSR
jgi:hypothetical protein